MQISDKIGGEGLEFLQAVKGELLLFQQVY